jgi:hypothetical protein
MASMLPAAVSPAFGIMGSVSEGVAADAPPSKVGENDSPFGQVVALYQSNSYLLSQLKSVRGHLSRAREYLASPGCNAALGRAHVLRLRARHSAALALLRANRHQARRLLARTGDPSGVATVSPRSTTAR